MNLMSVSGGDGVGLMMHPWALERSMGEVKANFPEHGQSLRLETVGKTVVEQSREEWERLDLPVDVLPWRGGGEGLRLGIRAVRAMISPMSSGSTQPKRHRGVSELNGMSITSPWTASW